MLSTQWRLHAAALYDRRMCLCQAAPSCSHCDVINQTLLQIAADMPMSNIIIGLTLLLSTIVNMTT